MESSDDIYFCLVFGMIAFILGEDVLHTSCACLERVRVERVQVHALRMHLTF